MSTQTHSKPPRWTPQELRWATSHIGTPGWSYDAVGRMLCRSREAVKLKLKRVGHRKPVAGPTERTLTLRDVMEVMGEDRHSGNHLLVRGWIKRRLLKASRVPMGGSRAPYVVYPADLLEFLQRYPDAYDRDRMPPSVYRDHAKKADPTAGLLTSKQAAKELGVWVNTLRRWRDAGKIPARHLSGPGIDPREWWYRREDVETAKARREWARTGWTLR